MRNTIKFLSFLIAILIIIVSCVKKEEPEPEPTPNKDNSLIIAEASTAKYVIVSPSTGEVLAEVQPNVISINQLALGYQSQKAIVTSKEPGGSATKVIFTCDRNTGNNLFQVTSENN